MNHKRIVLSLRSRAQGYMLYCSLSITFWKGQSYKDGDQWLNWLTTGGGFDYQGVAGEDFGSEGTGLDANGGHS